MNVVKTTFPNFNEQSTLYCGDRPLATDLLILECQWQEASRLSKEAGEDPTLLAKAESSLFDFSRTAQRIMSNASSNYTLTRLYQGTAVALAAVLVSLFTLRDSFFRLFGAIRCFVFVFVGYATLMFASSYVEEEQQFWYWILTGWTSYLYLRTYVTYIMCTDAAFADQLSDIIKQQAVRNLAVPFF